MVNHKFNQSESMKYVGINDTLLVMIPTLSTNVGPSDNRLSEGSECSGDNHKGWTPTRGGHSIGRHSREIYSGYRGRDQRPFRVAVSTSCPRWWGALQHFVVQGKAWDVFRIRARSTAGFRHPQPIVASWRCWIR